MPYINSYLRDVLDKNEEIPSDAGQLNYLITQLCIKYMENHARYDLINDVIGALECAKLEFYRRLAAPYEDKKIVENGDVY